MDMMHCFAILPLHYCFKIKFVNKYLPDQPRVLQDLIHQQPVGLHPTDYLDGKHRSPAPVRNNTPYYSTAT
jgi:hypothetical protein